MAAVSAELNAEALRNESAAGPRVGIIVTIFPHERPRRHIKCLGS